ncbi:MAG TPA: S41 family peptidase [Gemmatimonadaceae bacterium]|nr:S41 family peptidase [Gemmatimonadaceae bacterium]
MKARAIVTVAVLSCAIVSGGWLVQRGLISTGHTAMSARVDGARLFEQVLERVQQEYVDSSAAQDVYRRAVDGLMLELGDPHSGYLTSDRLNRLNETTSGQYAGVGLEIDVRDGWITVVRPIPSSPAEEAGLRTGDRVVEINGKPTYRWTREEAQKGLRGEAGTPITLAVERFGAASRIPFRLTRRRIHIRPVQHSLMLRDGVGYVDLVAFSDSAAPELRRQIDSLRRQGMSRLILDLRNDPGGLLDQGVAVAELFLDPGQEIVSMRGRTPEVTRDYADRQPQPWPDLMLSVLVDSNSASASEIVAGALQDHDRAVLLGTTTYGKGSAQTVYSVEGGGLKLTIARWFTPSGRSITRPHGPAVNADSMKKLEARAPKFRTAAGRAVNGNGGIRPDIVITDSAASVAAITLTRAVGTKANDFRDVVTSYAMSFKSSGAIRESGFAVTPEMRGELLRRLAERKVVIDSATARAASAVLDRILALQIERYVFGNDAEFRRSLRDDQVVQRAVSLLASAKSQKEAIESIK